VSAIGNGKEEGFMITIERKVDFFVKKMKRRLWRNLHKEELDHVK